MKTRFNYIFGLLLIVASYFFIYKVIQKNNVDQNIKPLVIGMMSGWAPFMSITPQGNYEGFDVDVATEIAQRLGRPVEIKDLGSLASLFIALEQNTIDMVFSGLDITLQRRNNYTMIPYTGQTVKDFYLVFWKAIPENIQHIEDFKQYPQATICVEPGVSTEKFIDQFNFINKKSIGATSEMILDIQYGRSLAAFLEPQVAKRLQQKNPEIKTLPVRLTPEFQIFGMGIALKKDAALSKNVETAIMAMRNDGTLKKLEIKWQLEA